LALVDRAAPTLTRFVARIAFRSIETFASPLHCAPSSGGGKAEPGPLALRS